MRSEKKTSSRQALLKQLETLKKRSREPGSTYWRKIGKLAQDFTVWLERARPWMSCASSLIALRVEQVMGDVVPNQSCESCLIKLFDLMEEADRQLSNPGLPIQVIDLNGEGKVCAGPEEESLLVAGGIGLPSSLVEIPEILRPQGNVPAQFLYIIPN